ncbi:hypothetical protein EVAR_89740_1 [Eumeta japonica]|uniref:Uncharacterized protein n=1 Tax=Eumeta variegata TaxID=151549 RepID=A0A4C1Y7L0_EUMVA|nr:hypothetical protein EVAR_89740_1 [Eumeta japonica]
MHRSRGGGWSESGSLGARVITERRRRNSSREPFAATAAPTLTAGRVRPRAPRRSNPVQGREGERAFRLNLHSGFFSVNTRFGNEYRSA